MRRRILSEDRSVHSSNTSVAAPHSRSQSARITSQLDLAIRGRLDGVDILSMGPLSFCHKNVHKDGVSSNEVPESLRDIDPLSMSLTDKTSPCESARVVNEMMFSNAGKGYPELIFEGYIPGGNDRWGVKLEGSKKSCSRSSSVTSDVSGHEEKLRKDCSPIKSSGSHDDDESTAMMTDDDGSTNLPPYVLWDCIWGSDLIPPMPSHMNSTENGTENDVLQLAANASVPIDLDDDTFIIDSLDHLRSVHDLTMVPIQVGSSEVV